MPRKKKKPTAVGVYVSAGGFSAGMSRHLEIISHLGDGEFGYDTLQANFPDVPYWARDDQRWPLDRLKVEEPDVMYCAPPCAPWSMGGGKGLNLDKDPRVAKVGHSLEAGWTVEPKIWMMESVVAFPKKSPEMVAMMEAAWRERGYGVTHFYSNLLLHGLPQNRNRYHFIAHRIPLVDPFDHGFAWPARLPVVADVLPKYTPKKSEIFSDASFKKFAEIVEEHVPQGHRVRKVFRDLAGLQDGEPGGPSFNLYRLRPEYPASTMISSPRIIHPNGKRIVTVKEAMALSGYPEDYIVEGRNEEKRYRELGKGVLPPMGEFLSWWFLESLGAWGTKNSTGNMLGVELIDWRDTARWYLRQKPPAYKFPPEKRGSMPELKSWYGAHLRRDEDDDEDED